MIIQPTIADDSIAGHADAQRLPAGYHHSGTHHEKVTGLIREEFNAPAVPAQIDVNLVGEGATTATLQENELNALVQKVRKSQAHSIRSQAEPLREIREKELWKLRADSFSNFCLNVFGFGEGQANHVIAAFEELLLLESAGISQTILPTTERVLRELRSIKGLAEKKRALEDAAMECGGSSPTAEAVRKVRRNNIQSTGKSGSSSGRGRTPKLHAAIKLGENLLAKLKTCKAEQSEIEIEALAIVLTDLAEEAKRFVAKKA